MKPPDRLINNAAVLKSMAQFWIALLFALGALLWMISIPGHKSDYWQVIQDAASATGQTMVALFIIVVGGKLFVMLFQAARDDPDRITRA